MRYKNIRFSPLFLLLTALFYVAGRLDVFFCGLLCAGIHETGHILAAKICNADIFSIGVNGYGMKITLKSNLYTSYLQDIFIALAGPFFNLLFALCAMPFVDRNSFVECFAGINLIFFFLNLLPISVLDGGRIFYSFLCLFLDPFRARKITNLFSVFFIFLLIITGFYVFCRTKYNVSLLLIGIWLSVDLIKQKVENP